MDPHATECRSSVADRRHSMARMPSVSLVDASAALRSAQAVVVGMLAGADGATLAAGGEPIDAALGGRLVGAVRAVGATGQAGRGNSHSDPRPRAVPTGRWQPGWGRTADGQRLDAENVRRAVGAAVRALDSVHPQHVHIAVG